MVRGLGQGVERLCRAAPGQADEHAAGHVEACPRQGVALVRVTAQPARSGLSSTGSDVHGLARVLLFVVGSCPGLAGVSEALHRGVDRFQVDVQLAETAAVEGIAGVDTVGQHRGRLVRGERTGALPHPPQHGGLG